MRLRAEGSSKLAWERSKPALTKTTTGITSFALKVIAIIGMTCNHVANVFSSELSSCGNVGLVILVALYALGGITFPIMAFLVSEGYAHTSNVKRYAQRIAAFALISQIPFSLLWGATGNVLITLLIGLMIIYAHDHYATEAKFAVIFVCGIIGSLLCDWAVVGPLMVYLFHSMRNQGKRRIILTASIPFLSMILAALIGLAYPTSLPQSSIIAGSSLITCWCMLGYALVGFPIASVLLWQYNGQRGKPLKWLFYIYYPLHLAVIYAISRAVS